MYRRIGPLVAALVALVVAAACVPGPSDVTSAGPSPSIAGASAAPSSGAPAASATAGPSSGPFPVASPTGSLTLRVYFFLGSFTGNAGLAPVLRESVKTVAVGALVMGDLIAGPKGAELAASPAMYTDIPDGTRLLALTIENGVATVNLSGEFASGGVPSTAVGRYAQVVFTLTQFFSVQSVRFELDGSPVAAPITGSTVTRPVTRADYQDQVPPIFLDRPAWGGTLGNPALLTGMANVFEETFRVAILDRAGSVIVDRQVTASCGTGCWGEFAVTVAYQVPTAGWGTLRVYDLAVSDGSRQDVTEYAVWLTP